MANILRKFLPESVVQKIRQAVLFRAEDPNNLHQILPPRVANTSVERIKGNRYPSPGSRGFDVKVPTRHSEDEVYNTNYFPRDHRLMNNGNQMTLNTTKGPLTVDLDQPRPVTHGKRKISLLPYDPSGLRTTKTVTWDSVTPVLNSHLPTHLPQPIWLAEEDEIQAERERKGLPASCGKRYNAQMSANYNQVKW